MSFRLRKEAGEQSGVIQWTNGTGSAVTAGSLVDLGYQHGVALVAIANGATGAVRISGQMAEDLAASTAVTAGQAAYLNASNKLTNDGSSPTSIFVGFFAKNQASGDTEAIVILAPHTLAPARNITLAATGAEDLAGHLFRTSLLVVNVANTAAKTVNLPVTGSIPMGADMIFRKTGGGAFALSIDPPAGLTIGAGSDGAANATIDADNDYLRLTKITATNLAITYNGVA